VEIVTEGGYVFGSGGGFAPDLVGFVGAARVWHGLGGGGEASPAEVRG